MKKILFVICIISLLISCKKEVSDMQTGYFIRFYGDALDDFAADIELNTDGGYVIAATTTRALPRTGTDIMLITTDKFGFQNSETIYLERLGNEKCTGLLVQDDGYILTGSYNDGKIETIDSILLVKIGKDGNLLWTYSNQSADFNGAGQGNDVALINNQIIVGGYNFDGISNTPFLCAFDLNGTRVANDPADLQGYYTSVCETNNQHFGFGTRTLSNATNTVFFVRENGLSNYDFPISGNETSSRIIKSADGGFYFVGTTGLIGSNSSQIVVKKIMKTGLQFSVDPSFTATPIGVDGAFTGVDIQEMADGRVAVLGDRTISKDTDIVLYFLNPDGSRNSSKIYGKTGNQTAISLKRTADGGLIILGNNQQEKTSSMITLIKTDSEGNIWE